MLRRNISFFTTMLAAVALSLVLLIAGCGGGSAGGSGSGNTGTGGNTGGTSSTGSNTPTIANAVASPAALPSFDGGPTAIQVDASDPSGIKQVVAAISKPDGTSADVTLTGSGTYSATFNTAPNISDKPVTYTAVVTVTDDSNHTATSTPITITVPTAETPPLPPTPSL